MQDPQDERLLAWVFRPRALEDFEQEELCQGVGEVARFDFWCAGLTPREPFVVVFPVCPARGHFQYEEMVIVHEVARAEAGCAQSEQETRQQWEEQGMSPDGVHNPVPQLSALFIL